MQKTLSIAQNGYYLLIVMMVAERDVRTAVREILKEILEEDE